MLILYLCVQQKSIFVVLQLAYLLEELHEAEKDIKLQTESQ